MSAFIVLLVLAGCAEEEGPLAPAIDSGAGKAIAQAHCTACHGMDGAGKTSEIPNLAAQAEDYLVEAMHAYREGRRHHAALQELITGFSETDIRNIAAYFSGLPPLLPASSLPVGETTYRQGAEVAAGCTACHGKQGVSTTPGIPSLAGQQPAYLIVATQEYASGARGHVEKETMLRGLELVDIEKMAMFFASQTPPPRDPPPFGDAQAGEPLAAMCGACHGARGVSQDPMVPNLAGQEPVYLVEAIKAYRNRERSHEDMMTDKSDSDIESIAAFYSVQTAESVIDEDSALSEIVAKCDRCHDRADAGEGMVLPNLNGQKQDYLLRVMKQYRNEDRGNSMMHKMSAGYSDALLEEIAAYYASRPAR
jgi:cytochrome c553